jgi:hypothetical protein
LEYLFIWQIVWKIWSLRKQTEMLPLLPNTGLTVQQSISSLDHPVGTAKQRRGNGEAEGFRCFDIHH